MTGYRLCDNCALKYADCKGNKDVEKCRCDYYKKPVVMNVKELAEKVADLEIENERLRRITEAPTVDSIQRWIPCRERLPKEKERVLTYDIIGYIDFGQYDKGQWYWEAEACADYWARNDGVIAWMPLPEPYKDGDTK